MYVPYRPTNSIDVLSPDGDLIGEIVHGEKAIPGDITLDQNGTIFLAIPEKGLILKIPQSASAPTEYVPGRFGHPSGIAIDHRERIFVSNFAGGEIYLVR